MCIGEQSTRPDKYFTNYNEVVLVRDNDKDDDLGDDAHVVA